MVLKTGVLLDTFAELDAGTQQDTDVVEYSLLDPAAIIIAKDTSKEYRLKDFCELGTAPKNRGEPIGGGAGGGYDSGASNPTYKPKLLHSVAMTHYVQFVLGVSDADAHKVIIFNSGGIKIAEVDSWVDPNAGVGEGAPLGFAHGPQGVCFDPDCYMIACDYHDTAAPGGNGYIIVFDTEFSCTEHWAPDHGATRCAADGDHIFVVSGTTNFVTKYDYDGTTIADVSDDGDTPAVGFDTPIDIAVYGDHVYIVDSENDRIVKLNKSNLNYSGQFAVDDPISVDLDADGNIYVLCIDSSGAFGSGTGTEYVVKIYNSAFVLQDTIMDDSGYVSTLQNMAVNPLKDIYLLDAEVYKVKVLVLPFLEIGSWTETIDAGSATEFTTFSLRWAYSVNGQTVTARVRSSNDGVTFGVWSPVLAPGMPIPDDQRFGRYLEIQVVLRQPETSGFAPLGWFDTPRVMNVLVQWEEAVWTFLEGEITFHLRNPNISSEHVSYTLPFARAKNIEGQPQPTRLPPGFGFTREVRRARPPQYRISITSDFYDLIASYNVLADHNQKYYIEVTYTNENTGVEQTAWFMECDFEGFSWSDEDSAGPTKITLTYSPKYIS